jgi:salicylate hydroxylase
VTLFERFDEPQPLGSGLILQPTGLAILGALGLGAAAVESSARIDRLFGRAEPSGRIVLDVRYSALPGSAFGLGIHRGALFHLLFDSVVAAGIAIETGREIVAAEGRRLLFASGGAAGPFDLIVDSLGSQSALAHTDGRALAYGALWTTLDWDDGFDSAALEQRYRRASKMVGVMPIGRLPGDAGAKAAFFWSLRADDFRAWREHGLERWKEEVLALWPATAPLLGQIRDPQTLTFARYRHRTHRSPVEPGLVHLGDSWHSTSPQLGQGANMALLDAAALAVALAGTADPADALAAYVRIRRRHVRLFQALSYVFTPFYQSDSRFLPLVRDHVAGRLSKIPPAPRLLATIVAGTLTNPLRRIGPLSWRAPPGSSPGIRTSSSASNPR